MSMFKSPVANIFSVEKKTDHTKIVLSRYYIHCSKYLRNQIFSKPCIWKYIGKNPSKL